MKICPITYDEHDEQGKYSIKGLRSISRDLDDLVDFPYDAEEQRREAVARAPKMSIQGVQLKLSARLDGKQKSFVIVDVGGLYILKPPSVLYRELPENEDLTMRLASIAGIEVPLHGLIFCRDGSMTYFVKRFDRRGSSGKLHVEDLAQLSGKSRDTKYESSMEQIVGIIGKYCTFPVREYEKLFRLTLVNFALGNEDMHLKNYSIISRDDVIELSPAYDLVNTTIALENAKEEIALPLRGKKRKLTRSLLVEYFASERLELNDKVIASVIEDVRMRMEKWDSIIRRSFLSKGMKEKYRSLVEQRRKILQI